MSAVSSEESVDTSFTTIFDFTGEESGAKSIENFDRIDDAIMGGISTSTLRKVTDQPFASFSGVCREDGG